MRLLGGGRVAGHHRFEIERQAEKLVTVGLDEGLVLPGQFLVIPVRSARNRVDVLANTLAPMMAANPAGKANRMTVGQCASRPTSPILKRLLARCTTAVMAMATDTGKNKARTGVRLVPSPKPEKKVRQEAPSALTLMIRMSMPKPVRAALFSRARDRSPG